jgi:hypothetical protein
VEGREPFRLMSMSITVLLRCTFEFSALALMAASAANPAVATITCRREYGDICYRGRFSMTSLTTGAAENALGQPA